MKRYAAWMLTAGLAGLTVGCIPYNNMVDRCWPERYAYTARREVVESFAPQVQNGHILDQTVWNYDFEKGSDQLNGMGLAKLDYMVRRRPAPDACIYLATARDLIYDPANADAYGNGRRDLDSKRVAAIQKYLTQQMVGRPMQFEVLIHDPFEVGMPAEEAAAAVRQQIQGAKGALLTSGGGGYSTGGTPGSNYGTGVAPGTGMQTPAGATGQPTYYYVPAQGAGPGGTPPPQQ
jgi:hypothetical protein